MSKKSIARSRRLWAAALASIMALVPILDATTGIDLVALMPVLDTLVNGVLDVGVAALAASSLIRPDAPGKEPVASKPARL